MADAAGRIEAANAAGWERAAAALADDGGAGSHDTPLPAALRAGLGATVAGAVEGSKGDEWAFDVHPCSDARGELARFVFVARTGGDASTTIGADESAPHSTGDHLTGLEDRTEFLAALEACVANADRRRTPFAVLFCDLDGFKLVNDLHGHEAGDAVLVEVAHRLRRLLRAHDTVARFGGDEFVVLLESLDEPSRAQHVAARIVEGVEIPILIGDTIANVGASVGVAVADGASVTASELLARADAAMYEAKRAGKGRVAQYGAALEERLHVQQQLRRDLHTATELDQLQLWYRPVVDLGSGELRCVEASLRWHHPARGVLTPDAFIDAADTGGTITVLDRFVLARAARDVEAWRGERHALHAWVTVSGRLLLQGEGAGWILETLRSAMAAAGSVGIEVSEDDVAHNFSSIAEILRELADGGVRVALDNFCGRLAVPQLQSLRPHTVKLDRSFLELLGANVESARAVRSVVGMIRPLGISIVAKGVDSREQLAAVINLNCDAAQGAIVGHAAPVDELHFDSLHLRGDGLPYLEHEHDLSKHPLA